MNLYLQRYVVQNKRADGEGTCFVCQLREKSGSVIIESHNLETNLNLQRGLSGT
ncbi:hypothetical protein LguiB_009746 [Lonicera macranthoides]